MGERFPDDGRALQWCVENNVHLLITPVPNSMEPFWVTIWDDRAIRRWRCTVVREAVQRFARTLERLEDPVLKFHAERAEDKQGPGMRKERGDAAGR